MSNKTSSLVPPPDELFKALTFQDRTYFDNLREEGFQVWARRSAISTSFLLEYSNGSWKEYNKGTLGTYEVYNFTGSSHWGYYALVEPINVWESMTQKADNIL